MGYLILSHHIIPQFLHLLLKYMSVYLCFAAKSDFSRCLKSMHIQVMEVEISLCYRLVINSGLLLPLKEGFDNLLWKQTLSFDSAN
jgi:hypothetical protein